ncbi:carbon-nitrogen hydrolase family protein [Natronomonas marina]|jgi:predicted amidohydrolase|uniref:carbon-nitrogen hydrolase family protein n=1 Tax=Natronomonas marina TaxID=2961939 RepID=UPI0020C9F507|nr:carbon-nitrogen hydrolase family protein [Natronomonas marina]
MSPTVAACQTAVDDLDVESNLETVVARVEALPDRVDVACFPEQALTGFVPDDRIAETALERDGPELDRLREVAGEAGIDLLVGYVERDDALYNAAAYLRADGPTTVYRKRHLWAGERELLEPGESLVTLETPLGRTGLLTCYDLNFVAESATLADKRVDALLVVGAWPATHSDNWRLLLRARALDGVRWTVGTGRTGRRDVEGARVTDYAGRSLVARPDGGIRAELDTDERDLVVDLEDGVLERQRDLVGVFAE